ncbi:hypothetical protein JTE90_004646 [Oedothorax gibbosus]|uniref:Uncharacterized protein n=1 Tax=Oedothorax gibbosus TaxID=931172 RepID=A0AAV6UXE9_9ARAC|nr:hypothetical protein JTE90_004646 [Oedothorax gibbosus]
MAPAWPGLISVNQQELHFLYHTNREAMLLIRNHKDTTTKPDKEYFRNVSGSMGVTAGEPGGPYHAFSRIFG